MKVAIQEHVKDELSKKFMKELKGPLNFTVLDKNGQLVFILKMRSDVDWISTELGWLITKQRIFVFDDKLLMKVAKVMNVSEKTLKLLLNKKYFIKVPVNGKALYVPDFLLAVYNSCEVLYSVPFTGEYLVFGLQANPAFVANYFNCIDKLVKASALKILNEYRDDFVKEFNYTARDFEALRALLNVDVRRIVFKNSPTLRAVAPKVAPLLGRECNGFLDRYNSVDFSNIL